MFLVTRTVEFSAAHRLYREDLSEEANRELFGACANPYGHGHNYRLEVTVQGPIDPHTGMVVHFQSLKRWLREWVLEPFDHRHLNHDVPLLSGILPTSENIVRILWECLDRNAQSFSWRLYRLRLSSTDRNSIEYFGPTPQL